MDVGLLHIRLLLDAEADLQVAALVVSAVATQMVSAVDKSLPAVLGAGTEGVGCVSTHEQLTSSLNSP